MPSQQPAFRPVFTVTQVRVCLIQLAPQISLTQQHQFSWSISDIRSRHVKTDDSFVKKDQPKNKDFKQKASEMEAPLTLATENIHLEEIPEGAKEAERIVIYTSKNCRGVF